jgi:hypothetical protein
LREIWGITKIEAAQRQLDAAIRMFFADDDWIAIHTLLAAGGVFSENYPNNGALQHGACSIIPSYRRGAKNSSRYLTMQPIFSSMPIKTPMLY